jgi:Rrf2 family protein
MQLTRAADYAVRVMIHLASQPEKTVISKALLAKETEAPESFLSKILQALARAGMIRARRGVVGGFSLLPRGAQASLLDVVESIDGPIAINVCLISDKSCNRYCGCAVHEVWRQAQAAMLSVLREAKIAQMVPASGVQSALLNVAKVNRSCEQDSTQAFSECLPQSSTKARTRSAAAGAMCNTRKKKYKEL